MRDRFPMGGRTRGEKCGEDEIFYLFIRTFLAKWNCVPFASSLNVSDTKSTKDVYSSSVERGGKSLERLSERFFHFEVAPFDRRREREIGNVNLGKVWPFTLVYTGFTSFSKILLH